MFEVLGIGSDENGVVDFFGIGYEHSGEVLVGLFINVVLVVWLWEN